METKVADCMLRVVKGDITDLDVQAFVFDITPDLKLGSGYGGAIAQRGGPSIQEELDALGGLEVGQAVVTGAGNMKAEYIVHTVGPKFQEEDEERKMRDAVRSALRSAAEKGIRRIAFPPLGSGMYFMPVEKSASLIVEAVRSFLDEGEASFDEIIFCGLDERECRPFENRLKGSE